MALLPAPEAHRKGSAHSRKDRKMKRQILIGVLPIWIIAVMACAGTMKGMDRYTGKRVHFSYEDHNFGTGEIQMTMPDGERFVGSMVDGTTADGSKDYPNVYEFPGNTEVFLQGDRGSEMRCKFRLSDTVLGFRGGGYGICETADGHVIDMFPR
jgi:hypothetical protein